MSDEDRRAHLRYRDPESTALNLSIGVGEVERSITGLMVNESYGGLACVYVGAPVEINSQVVWQEAENIGTRCRVLRCQKLYTDVYLLALQIADYRKL
jgi:hypothetical protein